MSQTPNLGLPYILNAQAQKHITHNEAIRMLDVVSQLTAVSLSASTPPSAPQDGQCWIVASSATGLWTGQEDTLAAWQDGAWQFYTPQPGWQVWVADLGAFYVWDGAVWEKASFSVNPVESVGINALADTQTRFHLASAASLFDH